MQQLEIGSWRTSLCCCCLIQVAAAEINFQLELQVGVFIFVSFFGLKSPVLLPVVCAWFIYRGQQKQ